MAGKRILVVEDEVLFAQDVQSRLRQLGYVVRSAASGEEALQQAERHVPDLVLMDIHLGAGLDGIATAERLQAQCDVPVVYLTAYADPETVRRTQAMHAFGYLLKPLREGELETTIEFALYKHQMDAQLHATNRRLEDEIGERQRVEEALHIHQIQLEMQNEDLRLAQAKIEKINAKYSDLYDFAPMGYCTFDAGGVILEANLTAARLFGMERGELINARVYQWILEVDRDRFFLHLRQVADTQARQICELRLNLPNASECWTQFETICVAERRYRTAISDITDRKRAEEALRQSEVRYRMLFEQAAIPLWEQDLSAIREYTQRLRAAGVTDFRVYFQQHPDEVRRCAGLIRVRDVNQAAVALYQAQSKQDLLNRLPQIFPDASLPGLAAGFAAIADGGMVCEHEAVNWTFTGELRYLIVAWVVMLGSETTYGTVMVSSLDITARKQAEMKLATTLQRFQTVMETVEDGITLSDESGYFDIFNSKMEEMTGYAKTEANAVENFLQLLYPHQPDYYQALSRLQELQQMSGVHDIETEICAKDGRRKTLLVSTSLIHDHDQTWFLSAYRDITRRKFVETELRAAKDAAEAANRAKSEFLANMSHELRTPLNAMLGFTQLLARDPAFTATHREYLALIIRSGEHLLTLISDILEMARIEAGRLILNPHRFDLWQTVMEIAEMMWLRAAQKGVEITVNRAADMPHDITTDETKLRQVLVNLLSNAIKFTNVGSVALRILDCEDGTIPPSPGRRGGGGEVSFVKLTFEISDTGIGIAPEDQPFLFDPFFQAQRQGAAIEGTGLGLAISSRFVRLLGGELQMESAVGRGSTFRFTIPVEVNEPAASDTAQSASPNRVVRLAPDHPEYRILVVEDHQENRLFLTQLLQSAGFLVRTAENGQEAVATWAQWQPHLIWMDMRMPVMDGYEATKRIRNEEWRIDQSDIRNSTSEIQQCKIIALTSLAFAEEQAAILASGCDAVMHKPVRATELFDMLRAHLGIRYVYEDSWIPGRDCSLIEKGIGSVSAADHAVLTPAMLAALPLEWLKELEQATAQMSLQKVTRAIAAIRQQDPLIADALTRFANDFRYKEIWAMLQNVHELKEG